jgi:photosystem I subunit 2
MAEEENMQEHEQEQPPEAPAAAGQPTLSGKPPLFGGSTGGLLTKAQVEEKYAITWTSSKKQVFEMPTGGAAIMNEGENLLYLARKEQCLALGTQLRTQFKPKIEDYKIYRIYPSGEIQYLHPADGVFPEKVNEGRPFVGKIDRKIGKNPEPVTLKFSGKATYEV